jgi:signal transduction histidine kinase
VSTLRLRSKILLAMLGISAGVTFGTLAVVRYTMDHRVRESLSQELFRSVGAYRTLQKQRENGWARTATLLAGLPTVRAQVATQDPATMQDGSVEILKESGADLLILTDRQGKVCALQQQPSGGGAIPVDLAQKLLNHSFEKAVSRDWWRAEGRLYQVVLQPVMLDQQDNNSEIGVLIAGHEIDARAARGYSATIGSEVIFRTGDYVISSAPDIPKEALPASGAAPSDQTFEVRVGNEHFLGATQELYHDDGERISLTTLKSFDAATAFLTSLNHLLAAIGLVAILTGILLGYTISRGVTQPLASLVEGVHALERGNYQFPLATESKDEVGVVTSAFNHLRTSLRQGQEDQRVLEERLRQAHKMEAVGRLAGGVAHDFNNLLTIIRGHADLLADRAENDWQKKSVDQIQKASNRAVAMTRQLLAFSRMQVLEPRPMDLNVTIAELGKMLPRLIGEHIEYAFEPQSDLHWVLADPGQIEQVLMNLAVNARDAMPHGGKLTVKTSNVEVNEAEASQRPAMIPGSYAKITVTDTGCGMDEETKTHIFEPFYSTKEAGKGTGLGLATAYGIVKQSRGFIWVETELGRGTTFEIFLPRTTERPGSQPEGDAMPGLKRGTETVLIAEDEDGVRDLAHQFLKRAGYKVLEARDGAEAIAISERYTSPIHLLLSDVVMPRMSGKELAETLMEARPTLKVVLMSGYSDFHQEGRAGGKFASMTKPFSLTSLLDKVDEVLHGAPVPEDAVKS